VVAFQFAYTTVFASIASAVFLSSRSFVVTALLHSFCNWHGLPDVQGAVAWPNKAQRVLLLLLYAFGPLAAYVVLKDLVIL
jgi:membrane protease YdiL (CAAX protease family)